MTINSAHAECAMCGQHDYCHHLHGDKGGPFCCLTCLGKWHGEHGRRRKWGRIVVRALAAYFDAGGKHDDFDKLKIAGSFGLDLLGYGTEDLITDAAPELTSELLTRAISLTHPDKHPPERRALAASVTGELTALQPFVFPAKEKKKLEPPPRDCDEKMPPVAKIAARSYPCSDCADAAPMHYCNACRAEYESRQQKEFEQRTAKQRTEYARRRQELLAERASPICAACGAKFESKRSDARCCSDRCRQKAHRKPVTLKQSNPASTLSSRDKLERAILALLDRHHAVYLNDLLPANRTSAQYQAVWLTAAKLEAEGKIGTKSYWVGGFNRAYPGRKVLTKLGHKVKHRKVTLLKDNERLQPGFGKIAHDEADEAEEEDRVVKAIVGGWTRATRLRL